VRYCIATDKFFISHPRDGKSLGWTSDFDEAKRTALSVNGRVYDADAFAKNPNPTQHVAIFDPTQNSQSEQVSKEQRNG
jgi:hypothetical protein